MLGTRHEDDMTKQYDAHCDAFDEHLWENWPPTAEVQNIITLEPVATDPPRYVICHSDTLNTEFLRTPPDDWVPLPQATVFDADQRDAYGEHAAGFWMAYERAEELEQT